MEDRLKSSERRARTTREGKVCTAD